MKKVIIFCLFLLNTAVLAQFRDDVKEEEKFRKGAPEFPKKTEPMFDNKRLNELEERKKNQKKLDALRAPHSEDLVAYREFLKQKKTGLFRLFPDSGCEEKFVINVKANCENVVPYSSSYSFIEKNYGVEDFDFGEIVLYDVQLKDESLIADGFFSQSIVVSLGNVNLDEVSLKTNGMEFLQNFKPATKSQNAQQQFKQIAHKVVENGFVYGKQISLNENLTYGIRLVNYQLADENKLRWSELTKIKSSVEKMFFYLPFLPRADKIITFRIVRKDADGSVTILWKELSSKKAPFLSFDKNEKLTDLK